MLTVNGWHKTTMLDHPSGVSVEILGTEESSDGRTCEEHVVCSSEVHVDVAVRMRWVQRIRMVTMKCWLLLLTGRRMELIVAELAFLAGTPLSTGNSLMGSQHKLWTFTARNRMVQQSARSSTEIPVVAVPLSSIPSSKKTMAVSLH